MRVAIVLAAGAGRRFGAPKPLARRGGRPLVAHALAAARAAPAARLILVVGRQGRRVAAAGRRAVPRLTVVHARDWRRGRAASLAAAIAALWPIERAAFLFLADMPDVPHALAARLGRRDARPVHRGEPGHPVLLGRAALAERAAGGRPALRAVAADRRCRFDVDRRRDLHRIVPALIR